MAAIIIPVEVFDLVIFGSTGDLARRKILPALYRRFKAGQIPSGARIIGAARSEMDDAGFQAQVRAALVEFAAADGDPVEVFDAFLALLGYVHVDAMGETGWAALAARLRADVVKAFYLSVAPALFGEIAGRLKAYGMAQDGARVVVEKPFGRELSSAAALNAALRETFTEHQIYRIDHYLGKETVQNLMAIRFANALFEPIWNARYIDHVQITVAETLGVEGRGAYYDRSGAMRDMVQNHLMQLLCLIAMEPPSHFDADAVRSEKLKVIRALKPLNAADIIHGQYRASETRGSYRDHAENPKSRTESFIALSAEIENWRWNGTPFYLRTGKCLRARMSEIAVQFKAPPHSIFDVKDERIGGNLLAIRLQPDEGITMSMTIKDPGPGGMRLRDVPLDMSFAEALGSGVDAMPDAYERLIMDVIRGDQTLFMRGDEVEAAWGWIDPAIAAWETSTSAPHFYDQGSSGPEEAWSLMAHSNRRWRPICE